MAVFMVSPAHAATPAQQALEQGNMEAMLGAVQAIYEEAGLSWDDDLFWNIEPYTTTYNYYDRYAPEIVMGAMPTPDEVDDYWVNWSATLTRSRWQPEDFFSSPADALDMARYNQFVIAIHEAGHLMQFRYDPSHVERHDYSVNCREFHADRLTAAVLQDEADRDPQMARYLKRYVELITSFDAAIPAEKRVAIPSLEALLSDCAQFKVYQPTPENLEEYASAFFARHKVLLNGDLPPLADLVDPVLFVPYREQIEKFIWPLPGDPYRLETAGILEGLMVGKRTDNDHRTVYRAIGFDLGGNAFQSAISYGPEATGFGLTYGPAGSDAEVLFEALPYKRGVDNLQLRALVPLSQTRFLLALDDDRAAVAMILDAKKGAEGWTVTVAGERDGIGVSTMTRDENGQIRWWTATDGATIRYNHSWQWASFDAETYETGPLNATAGSPGIPLGADSTGHFFVSRNNRLMYLDDKADYNSIAGNLLRGSKDGVRWQDMEINDDMAVVQAVPDGRIFLLDEGLDRDEWRVRVLIPAPDETPAAPGTGKN